jgi:hypothetical protein
MRLITKVCQNDKAWLLIYKKVNYIIYSMIFLSLTCKFNITFMFDWLGNQSKFILAKDFENSFDQ